MNGKYNRSWSDKRSWLVVLGAGTWQAYGIRRAQELGLNVFALDGDAKAPALELAEKACVTDISNPDKVLTTLLQSRIRPAGVVSFCSEAGMMAAARIREYFDLPGPDSELTLALTNKAVQREIWMNAKIPGPNWMVFGTEDRSSGVSKATRQIGYPCVVKPLDKAGSRGVSCAEDETSLLNAIDYAFKIGGGSSIIIESFLKGTEYTLETFTENGITEVLAIAKKRKVCGSMTVAMELVTGPWDYNFESCMTDTVCRALQALGYRDGPGHTEVIFSENGALGIVETAGRGGGFMVCDRFVPAVSGFDVTSATIRCALGEAAGEQRRFRRSAVLRFFPSHEGVVRDVTGFDRACELPGVEARPFVAIGDSVKDARSDGDRLGYILSVDETLEKAISRADEGERLVNIDVS